MGTRVKDMNVCGIAGVLTKLDIMDRGTDASAILRNEAVPLRLGYIGMINRSQADINTRRSIRDAIAAETAFFESHPAYQEVSLVQFRQASVPERGPVRPIVYPLPKRHNKIDEY